MEFGERLRLLASPNRRRLLWRLRAAPGGVVDVGEALPGGSLRADRQAVRPSHVDLPMLADAGVIDWERDATVVERGPAFDDVAPLLDPVRDGRDERDGGRNRSTAGTTGVGRP
jgi:hypothetical protein